MTLGRWGDTLQKSLPPSPSPYTLLWSQNQARGEQTQSRSFPWGALLKPFMFSTRLHYGQHELRMYKKFLLLSFFLFFFMKEWPCRSIWSKTLYVDGKKNKEREDEKETKDPYLNVKFSEPSMSQLFSLPRPKVFIKSLLPTGCELNLYLLKLLLFRPCCLVKAPLILKER